MAKGLPSPRREARVSNLRQETTPDPHKNCVRVEHNDTPLGTDIYIKTHVVQGEFGMVLDPVVIRNRRTKVGQHRRANDEAGYEEYGNEDCPSDDVERAHHGLVTCYTGLMNRDWGAEQHHLENEMRAAVGKGALS